MKHSKFTQWDTGFNTFPDEMKETKVEIEYAYYVVIAAAGLLRKPRKCDRSKSSPLLSTELKRKPGKQISPAQSKSRLRNGPRGSFLRLAFLRRGLRILGRRLALPLR